MYNEVAKATDYTGSKLIDGDENARNVFLPLMMISRRNWAASGMRV